MTNTNTNTNIEVGDFVKVSKYSSFEYEVAEIKKFPHGKMIGIYDENNSLHIDYWNPDNLFLSRKASESKYKLIPYHNPQGIDESKAPTGLRFRYEHEAHSYCENCFYYSSNGILRVGNGLSKGLTYFVLAYE